MEYTLLKGYQIDPKLFLGNWLQYDGTYKPAEIYLRPTQYNPAKLYVGASNQSNSGEFYVYGSINSESILSSSIISSEIYSSIYLPIDASSTIGLLSVPIPTIYASNIYANTYYGDGSKLQNVIPDLDDNVWFWMDTPDTKGIRYNSTLDAIEFNYKIEFSGEETTIIKKGKTGYSFENFRTKGREVLNDTLIIGNLIGNFTNDPGANYIQIGPGDLTFKNTYTSNSLSIYEPLDSIFEANYSKYEVQLPGFLSDYRDFVFDVWGKVLDSQYRDTSSILFRRSIFGSSDKEIFLSLGSVPRVYCYESASGKYNYNNDWGTDVIHMFKPTNLIDTGESGSLNLDGGQWWIANLDFSALDYGIYNGNNLASWGLEGEVGAVFDLSRFKGSGSFNVILPQQHLKIWKSDWSKKFCELTDSNIYFYESNLYDIEDNSTAILLGNPNGNSGGQYKRASIVFQYYQEGEGGSVHNKFIKITPTNDATDYHVLKFRGYDNTEGYYSQALNELACIWWYENIDNIETDTSGVGIYAFKGSGSGYWNGLYIDAGSGSIYNRIVVVGPIEFMDTSWVGSKITLDPSNKNDIRNDTQFYTNVKISKSDGSAVHSIYTDDFG
ncbi:MAG: hypothetical protein ACTSWR_04055, partial [Candidatus Helarchaeota archaeon]